MVAIDHDLREEFGTRLYGRGTHELIVGRSGGAGTGRRSPPDGAARQLPGTASVTVHADTIRRWIVVPSLGGPEEAIRRRPADLTQGERRLR
jgi:hypothetical protein